MLQESFVARASKIKQVEKSPVVIKGLIEARGLTRPAVIKGLIDTRGAFKVNAKEPCCHRGLDRSPQGSCEACCNEGLD